MFTSKQTLKRCNVWSIRSWAAFKLSIMLSILCNIDTGQFRLLKNEMSWSMIKPTKWYLSLQRLIDGHKFIL